MLEKINSPMDIKDFNDEDIKALSKEIRHKIIGVVSKNGGHLSSNLGMVEPTIVIHQVFDSPKDSIIFDVGHQAYTHKLLTGRYNEFDSLRRFGGLSGFTNCFESEHDTFSAGHSGTALAQAMGIAEANKLSGKDNWAIAIVGDGATTNGLFYEALNNCSGKDVRLLIILNDNEMSISKNVGGMSKHLSRIRTSKSYYSFKDTLKKVFSRIPLIGNGLIIIARAIKNFIKRVFTTYNVFESLGLDYLGVIDGKDTKRLRDTLEYVKQQNHPCIVHIVTKKGDGYKPAEEQPDVFHSVGKFDAKTGKRATSDIDFSKAFGTSLVNVASKNDKVCAITAAMKDGTGLTSFAEKYPDRFFDVGIAEEYAVTFAAGLAKKGYIPVCAIYSTFAQRVYDELWHDLSLQKLPMVLMLDRSGIVPGDGCTHQGVFDYSLFSSIPGVNIYSPETYKELDEALNIAVNSGELSIIRYPKGIETDYDRSSFVFNKNMSIYAPKGEFDALFITYGRITSEAYKAVKMLENETNAAVLKLKKIAPLDYDEIFEIASNAKVVYLLEEGVRNGSVSEKIAASLKEKQYEGEVIINTLPNDFLPHGTVEDIKTLYKLNAEQFFN